jgi:hypothetical protein
MIFFAKIKIRYNLDFSLNILSKQLKINNVNLLFLAEAVYMMTLNSLKIII